MSVPKTDIRDPWRSPDEESLDFYPGLVVHDGRVSGSITVGRSRLPLWAFMALAVRDGWSEVETEFSPTEHYRYTAEDAGLFLTDLLNLRGDFARLLLVMADEERRERADRPWWTVKRARKRVAAALRDCLAVVEEK